MSESFHACIICYFRNYFAFYYYMLSINLNASFYKEPIKIIYMNVHEVFITHIGLSKWLIC